MPAALMTNKQATEIKKEILITLVLYLMRHDSGISDKQVRKAPSREQRCWIWFSGI
jgi:hypothetical protein